MTLMAPHVVFLSGTLRNGSKADQLARWCAQQCREGTTTIFTGTELEFPFYRMPNGRRGAQIQRYLTALATADGIVVISPVYHGTVSGLLKNALDYVNDLADDRRPFLEGRPIGCVALAEGDQGAASTIATLRTIAHALRGWPTPLGVTLSRDLAALRPDGEPVQAQTRQRLGIMLDQVLSLARHNANRRVDGDLLPPGGVLPRASGAGGEEAAVLASVHGVPPRAPTTA
jgi:NAD(P)H-dependent FMN reductase